ncbi:unnamed protein product [Kuraishia capsulata CBS 1993]|uniref:Nuclear pore complex protein n=1 Tax=Kuraishia capsulata CBS 1993 TaxID=1382522 RepID=W6MV24_9ASCO|nr:uncharacterized protein KUCA_T00001996001 [Kuraishia capsulata CBS 1993]CDK26025.1 unnamed protein product [Kuraishia capsulata CBS 1993]
MVEGSILGSISDLDTVSFNTADEVRPMVQFAKALQSFKNEPSSVDLFGIVHDFGNIAASEILAGEDEGLANDAISNWVLESRFWALVEIIIKYRFSERDSPVESSKNFNEFTSRSILQDWILQRNPNLRELWFVMTWLADALKLDPIDEEDDVDVEQLQPSKWISTKAELQSNKPRFVKNLDADAPVRTNSRISDSDANSDRLFFKKAFHLLLERDEEELAKVSELTNNWTFSMIIAGTQDYIDPLIDGSFLAEDDSMDLDTRPIGIKNSLLWRRTVFNLSQQKGLNDFERATYEFLCGDVEVSARVTNSWERQLLLYLNNIFKCEMESQLVELLKVKQPNSEELVVVNSMRVPTKSFSNLTEVLSALASSGNEIVKTQSEHPIRVLAGSILTDNVGSILENSLDLINQTISGAQSSLLTSNGYLLRMVVHFAIFMRLLDSSLLSDTDFTKFLRIYITRLSLYKLFDEIPLYVSFMPDESDMIDSYSFFLSNMVLDPKDRSRQLQLIRELGLPLEDILKRTVNRVFEDTNDHYSPSGEIVLLKDPNTTSKVDIKLFTSVLWLVEEKMWTDAVEATIVIMRRFLSRGKVGSLISFYNSMEDLNLLLDNYKLHHSVISDHFGSEGTPIVSRARLLSWYQVEELHQNIKFIQTFMMLNSHEKLSQLEVKTALEKTNLLGSAQELDLDVRERAISWYYDLLQGSYHPPEYDLQVYQDFRVMYVPFMIETLFGVLTSSKNGILIKQGIDLVNLVSDDAYQLDQLFVQADKLESFLNSLANVSISAFETCENGIYE